MDHGDVDDSFTVDELKAECRRRGLVTTKDELIRKLNKARADAAEAEIQRRRDQAAAAAAAEQRLIPNHQLEEGRILRTDLVKGSARL